jgi:hypothetical protein
MGHVGTRTGLSDDTVLVTFEIYSLGLDRPGRTVDKAVTCTRFIDFGYH